MADAETFVVMRLASGQGEDTQWFDYMPTYFGPPIRIEWDKGTMFAALPADAAGYLVSRGYARLMTEAEIEAYTAPASDPVPASRRKPQKEISDDPNSVQ